ncbi:MAG: response regulator transcription factor [Bacteroidota bacterium]
MAEIKKNIILVDDHVIIRNGLKELIEKLGPYHIIFQFDNGQSLLDALPLKPEPDLIIMDISMPGMNGDVVMEKMLERQCKIPTLILTLNEDDAIVIKLFRLGARGYLQKNCTAPVLKEALNAIFEKGYYHNEFLTYSLQTNTHSAKKNEQERILEQLTAREKEFLKLVCNEQEYTYGQIADKMAVQPRTVDGYREAIFEKFGIKSKTGLVLFVLKHKLSDFL